MARESATSTASVWRVNRFETPAGAGSGSEDEGLDELHGPVGLGLCQIHGKRELGGDACPDREGVHDGQVAAVDGCASAGGSWRWTGIPIRVLRLPAQEQASPRRNPAR
jgi:hypothetical protein